jgi:hypothetical protein
VTDDRNSLVFLAADKVRLQDLDEALRRYLAWTSILAEKETLDLSPFQVRQAETQKQATDSAVTARLPTRKTSTMRQDGIAGCEADRESC